MSEPTLEDVLRRLAELERENAELKKRLEQLEKRPPPRPSPPPSPFGPAIRYGCPPIDGPRDPQL